MSFLGRTRQGEPHEPGSNPEPGSLPEKHAAPVLRGGPVARSAWLVAGLFLCACGIVAFLESRLGLSPWDVLHQGIAKHTPLSFGLANVVVAIGVLFLAWRLGSRPGIGTVA